MGEKVGPGERMNASELLVKLSECKAQREMFSRLDHKKNEEFSFAIHRETRMSKASRASLAAKGVRVVRYLN
jgi:hypothetical protein